jgi:hypothetical protein
MVKNQGESDVDCGGANCSPCADGKACTASTDCNSGNCLNGKCSTPNCSDGVLDGSETDVDCGGTCATQMGMGCANLKKCKVNDDCTDHGCVMGTCLEPTCTDAVQDGAETDKDCGGDPTCPVCADGKLCSKGTDCMSTVCGVASVSGTTMVNKCFPATCGNGMLDTGESDTDCGGSCPLCPVNAKCTKNADCQTNGCVMGTCQQPTCADTVADGNETDVDCGGGTCPGCAKGKKCLVNSDCSGAMMCVGNICQ